MKALQILSPGKAEVVELPEPGPPPPGHVKIRMRASGICGLHEWNIFNAAYTRTRDEAGGFRPGFPGREGAGEVVETGPRVGSLKPGDRVVLGGGVGDLHRGYVTAPEKWALMTTSERPWASLTPTDLFARMLALLRSADKILRANAVIIGLGPAGLAALLWLKVLGARKVTGIELDPARSAAALKLGIDEVIPATDRGTQDLLAKTRPETVIECSGTHTGIRTSLDMAAHEALLFGITDSPLSIDLSAWRDKGLAVKTRTDYEWPVWEEVVACMNRGLIDPGALVTHTLPFSADSYARALGMISRREALRVVLEFPTDGEGDPVP